MQATLDASSIKPFTRALTCLSRYGEELSIHASPTTLSLSAVNAAKSAYCRFQFARDIFSKYRLSDVEETGFDDVEEVPSVTGQLLTKALLSILKHRTVEKSVEKCELTIIEGSSIADEDNEQRDGLESKLVVKLHCKHGVVKTHRLLLLATTSLMTPNVPDPSLQSRLCVAPKALKDMIEHFSINKGAKSDPQLIWRFEDDNVTLKTMDSSLEASKGRVGLSTELTLNAEEFDAYDLQDPVTIAFHLRELNATIAFAESLGTTLDIHFTEPAAPLCIDVEGLSIEGLFVISTIQVPGENHVTMSQTTATANGVKKREREETPYESARFKKSMKVVHTTPLPSGSRSSASVRGQSVMSAQPPASLPRAASFFADRPNAQSTPRDMPPPPLPIRGEYAPPPPARREESEEPLFLPASSQLSQAEVEVLRSTGLGIENMDAEEFANMLEGDGEEVAFDLSQPNFALQASQTDPGTEEINMEFISTQSSGDSESKDFHPLFED